MAFQLDTTGRVECAASFQPLGWAIWSDLTPFAQGYVEALFDANAAALNEARIAARLPLRRIAFRDLAPETLARIIVDCEEYRALAEKLWSSFGSTDEGRGFWTQRQRGEFATFPPLTVQLADDGKVRSQ